MENNSEDFKGSVIIVNWHGFIIFAGMLISLCFQTKTDQTAPVALKGISLVTIFPENSLWHLNRIVS